MASKIATTRLRKEFVSLQKDPPPGIIAEPNESDILVVYYALRGPPDTVYQSGVYVGKLKFPPTYPMKPPSVYMLTPSGRFECNKKICMSMSDFHPESWNPMWSVGTILTGIQSFMASDELTTGGIVNIPDRVRRGYAERSMAYNETHFAGLFQGDILGALERADQAHRLASERAKTTVAVGSNRRSTSRRQTRARAQATPKDNVHTGSHEEEEQDEDEIEKAPSVKELTPEEAEKRRQKNAKKRAKQKARKAAATIERLSLEDKK